MKNVSKLCLTLILVSSISMNSCGKKKSSSDDESPSEETPEGAEKSSTEAPLGSLAIPLTIDLGSPMLFYNNKTSLTEDSSTGEYPSISDKKEKIDEILEAKTIEACFKDISIKNYTQPACFSPSLDRATLEAAAHDAYTVSFDPSINNLRYGDGGMVSATNGNNGESCSAATVNYYYESSLEVVEYGKSILASLICASKFNDRLELPSNASKEYKDDLKTYKIGGKGEIISAKVSNTGDLYETRVGVKFSDKIIWSFFSSSKEGTNIITIKKAISSKPALNNPPPQNPPASESKVVSVRHKKLADGSEEITFDQAMFKDPNANPIDHILENGEIDLKGIASTNPSNTYIANITRAYMKSKNGEEQGNISWTASLNDGFWRSLSYNSTNDKTKDSKMFRSGFGFSKGLDPTSKVLSNPTMPLGMFCSWAYQDASPYANTSILESSQLSGKAYNGIQYQVITNNNGRNVKYAPYTSNISYTVGRSDCGDNSGEKNLKIVDAEGKISTDSAYIPTSYKEVKANKVKLVKSEIDLD